MTGREKSVKAQQQVLLFISLAYVVVPAHILANLC